MIYFVQAVVGGPVKIGYSDDVPRRVEQLERAYGRPLVLLATMDGGADEEAEIHARFAHLRMGRTEQFRPSPDLMGFIGRPSPEGIYVALMEPPPGSTRGLATFKGTDEMAAWLDGLVSHAELGTRPFAIRRGLKLLAEKTGYDRPMPKR